MNQQTLSGALEAAFRRWPDRPALTFEGRSLTFAEFESEVAALAGALRRLGVGRGDRVVCQLPNRPELLTTAAATWARAAVYVGADHELTGPELCVYLRLTGAKALVYAPVASSPDPFLPLRVVRERHPDVQVIVVGAEAPAGALAFSGLTRGPARDAHSPADGPAPEDPAVIFTTSGTTGRPKMPVIYHGRLQRSWVRLAAELSFGPEDAHLVQLPLAHGLGMMLALAGLVAGGRLVLVERFSAAAALALVGRERVTVLNGSPAHFRLILDGLTPGRHDVSSLRTGVASGAAFSTTLLRRIFDELRMSLMLMYGASEGVGVATSDRAEILRGSVGRPLPDSVAVVGPDRRPLPAGEVGEIAFSREVFPVRYWGAADDGSPSGETHEVAAGWYYTGDLGRVDDEGLLYVVGRLKLQINRGGLKVDPSEVEGALLRCAGVADAAVLGVPNPVLGEVVCACVVPSGGDAPSLENLRAELRRELARYKLPDELCVLDRIPRTGVGKVDVQLLRAEVGATPARQRVAG